MIRTPEVLLLTDGSSQAELQQALSLAAPFRGHIHALILASKTPPGLPAAVEIEYSLARLRAQCVEDPGEVTTTFVDVSMVPPKTAILRYAEEHNIDLMIVVRHPHPDRLITPNLSMGLISDARCPVITYSNHQHPPAGLARRPHILVPSDFSDCSQHALAHAREIANLIGARITVFHSIQQKSLLHGADNPVLQNLISNTTRPGFYVAPLKEICRHIPGPDVEMRFRVVNGPVLRSILQFLVSDHPDLIVLSTHGLTGIRHYAMGRTTEQIIRQTTLPIFLVKAFGKPLVPIHLASFRQPAIASFTRLLHDALEENQTTPVRVKPAAPVRTGDHTLAVREHVSAKPKSTTPLPVA